jgi:hypothetical protein
MAEKRVNKPVSGFGSSKLRKPWYLDLFPDSLHPFLTGLFRKDSNEWSRKENEQFEQAVSMAKKLKGVENRMGLLNPGLDEETDDPHLGEVEGNMMAYKDDYQSWSPEVLSPSTGKEDEGDSALDVIALDDKRREDEYLAGLLASEENLDMYDDSPDKQDMLDIGGRFESRALASEGSRDYDPDDEAFDHAPGGSSGGTFFASGESGGESKGLSPMQKYGAKLVMDMFKEKEQRPQQSIGASPILPGRTMDMSKYVSSRRPSKERYRNLGLLARGTV